MAIQKVPQTYIDNNGCWTPVHTALNKINEVIDAIEGGTGSDIVATSVTTNTINEQTPGSGVTIDGVLISNTLDGSGIVAKTGTQTIAGAKTFSSSIINSVPITYSETATITAFAGGGQGSATLLTTEQNNVTTVVTAGDSVKLPVAVIGYKISVKNNGAADLAVFPNTSGTINGGSANASITIPVGATKVFEATTVLNWESYGVLTTQSGSVARPSHTFNNQSNQGMYSVSSTQLGFSVAGALQAVLSSTAGWLTGSISELVTGSGILFNQAIIRKNTAFAVNSTATIIAANLAKGLITSTSAAPTTITLDTATAIASQLGATQGTIFDFVVDNSAGASTVTIAVGAGIVASGFPGTNTLTLANSATIGTATFRLVFISTTAATLARIS